jgi:amino acid adenylation domain-containing protein
MDVVKENVKNIYPLIPMQEGLLFHALAEPGSPAYFQQLSLRLSGTPDPGLIEQAANELVRRHDVLRTVFNHAGAERLLQIVLKERRITLTVQDFSALDPAARAAAVQRFKAADRARPFDLTRDMLMRIAVLRLGPREAELVWSHHHILMDGWSMGLLQAEFIATYGALRRGETARLAPVTPFAGYVKWLQKRDAEASRRFWHDRLTGYRGPAGIPALPDARKSAPLAVTSFTLDAETVARLTAAAGARGVTLNSVVQTLWGVLLARYNRTRDVVFGALVSGRPAEIPGIERMVGLLINTIPVRVRFDARIGLGTLTERLQAEALAAEPHHFYPLARIQADSALPHGLFGTLLALENYPLDEKLTRPLDADALGFAIEGVESFEQTHYGFVVQVLPGDGLRFRITYDTGTYAADQVTAIEGHLRALVRAFLETPDRPVLDIDLLTASEQAGAMRAAGTDGSTVPAEERTLVDWFETTAAARGDVTALVLPGEGDAPGCCLSYAELDRWADRLAARLRSRGVGPESRVGLCAGRSRELVVAVLAILKAGAAYVPLDPAYPAERLAFMAADAGLALILAQPGATTALAGTAVPVEPLPDAPDTLPDPGPRRPAPIGPDNAAYVIYTSGSTGRPKGCVVTHRNVTRLFAATARFGFGPADTWTLFHSIAFDFSVWELWGALLYGGRLVIVPYWISRAPDAFAALLRRERVSVLNQTPSAFRQLIPAEATSGAPDDLALRLVIFGGEALEPRTLVPWVERHGLDRPLLVNMYGITETTVHVTLRPLGAADLAGRASVIGAPLGDLRLYVLDAALCPAPLGVAGELFVGGAGLARGYLGRPELSAERFIPDPFGAPGARLYRTGDLARRLPGGELEYLGRIDHQVKIRGFRIELGEIEAALHSHAGVQAAVVLARGAAGVQKLVAYVVGPAGAAELRRHVAECLPDYMVPAAFVSLAALPLTENGKLDRAALPQPEAGRAANAAPAVAPRTESERSIAAVWREVLGCHEVGIHDNFFDLGGHSLLLVQAHARLQAWAGPQLSLLDLFQHPTIHSLAEHLARAGKAAAGRLPNRSEARTARRDTMAQQRAARRQQREEAR